MILLLATLLLAQPAEAQPQAAPPPAPPAAEAAPAPAEHAAAPAASERTGEAAREEKVAEHEESIADHIFHHVQDQVVVPLGFWAGNHYIRLDITKHVINMWIAAGILLIVVGLGARKRALIPKGGYNLLETFVMFVRDEISVKNIGHHADLYTPYLCSAFFFILFMNLSGLLPIPAYGGFPGISTATGNVSVTMVLALFTFALTQFAGMRAQGVVGLLGAPDPSGVPLWLHPIMLPVEFLGLFTKPFALTVRLFANMVAGHIVIFFLSALIFASRSAWRRSRCAFALGIFMLELFVGASCRPTSSRCCRRSSSATGAARGHDEHHDDEHGHAVHGEAAYARGRKAPGHGSRAQRAPRAEGSPTSTAPREGTETQMNALSLGYLAAGLGAGWPSSAQASASAASPPSAMDGTARQPSPPATSAPR